MLGLAVGVLAILAGCSRPPARPAAPDFYPPLPEKPRVQFLCALNSSEDVRPQPGGFARFVLGASGKREVDYLVRPYGMALWEGKLYVCDSGARRGDVFDFKGKDFRTFGEEGPFRLGLPVNVSVGPEGEKYVTDTLRGQVLVLDRDDRPARSFVREDEMKPCDAVRYGGELFVADLKTNTILVLDAASGKLLRQFGRAGSEPGEFYQPTNLAFGPEGHLFVSDTLNARVQELDRDGKVVRVIGSRGRALGQMVRPKGIAVDRAGRLYVCDAATESVQLFDPEGRLLMIVGRPGSGRGGLSLPAKVALSYDGVEYFAKHAALGFHVEYLIFVSSQLGPSKINVYAFGTYSGAPRPGEGGLERVILPSTPAPGPKQGH